MKLRLKSLTAAILAAAIAGCASQSDSKPDTAASSTAAAGTPTPATAASAAATPAAPDSARKDSSTAGAGSDMRLEVDLAKRQLLVYSGGKVVETHPVAVGSTKWPTQTGEWTIKQVVYNPEWIPPDESWAEEREPRKPGDPKNPLGKAQLVYDPPRTIHGTNEPTSIGKAVSHGSIRMRNEDLLALAPKIMTAGGATKDAAWISAAQAKRTEKQIVDLPHPIPIKVF